MQDNILAVATDERETAWTPGPWLASKASADDDHVSGFEWYLYAPNFGAVGYWTGHKSHHKDERWFLSEADANLIAAAPDLYEALEEIRDMLWSRPDISDRLRPLMGFAEEATNQKAAAALAKARGQS